MVGKRGWIDENGIDVVKLVFAVISPPFVSLQFNFLKPPKAKNQWYLYHYSVWLTYGIRIDSVSAHVYCISLISK